MNKLLAKIFKREESEIKHFIKKNNEFLTIPLGVIIFILAGWLFGVAGITAIYDAGIFQSVIWTGIALLFIKAFTWIMLWLEDPYQKQLIDSDNNKFKELPVKWQFAITYGKYFLYFISAVLIVVFA